MQNHQNNLYNHFTIKHNPNFLDASFILTLTDESKRLFNEGIAEQGYIGVVEIDSGKIHLLPAFNKDDGKKRLNKYNEKFSAYIESTQPRGVMNGDLHTFAASTLGLVEKSGANGLIFGFSIWKSKDGNILEIRNRSSSQNYFSSIYNEDYADWFKEQFLNHSAHLLNLRRELPLAIINKIIQYTCQGLDINPPNSLEESNLVPNGLDAIREHLQYEKFWIPSTKKIKTLNDLLIYINNLPDNISEFKEILISNQLKNHLDIDLCIQSPSDLKTFMNYIEHTLPRYPNEIMKECISTLKTKYNVITCLADFRDFISNKLISPENIKFIFELNFSSQPTLEDLSNFIIFLRDIRPIIKLEEIIDTKKVLNIVKDHANTHLAHHLDIERLTCIIIASTPVQAQTLLNVLPISTQSEIIKKLPAKISPNDLYEHIRMNGIQNSLIFVKELNDKNFTHLFLLRDKKIDFTFLEWRIKSMVSDHKLELLPVLNLILIKACRYYLSQTENSHTTLIQSSLFANNNISLLNQIEDNLLHNRNVKDNIAIETCCPFINELCTVLESNHSQYIKYVHYGSMHISVG